MDSNGEEGINKIEQNDYGLILIDIKMSVISGNQVCDHLRNKTKKTTPIIAMSDTPWPMNQSGFDAVLEKPFSLEDLLDLINSV